MKKALSIVMAIAILFATLPISTGIVANAACTHGSTDLLEFGDYLVEAGSSSKWYDTILVDNGETGTQDDPIIIDSAEEFVYLAKGIPDDTAGKYYKVADGISAFDLSKGNLKLNGTLGENIDIIKSSGKNHSGGSPGFQGTFDGNGVTIYGAWTNHTEGNVGNYSGLFSVTRGNVTIKNVNVKLSSFTSKTAAGGIVGYHKGDGNQTLTIENCSVTDTHIENLQSGWGCGIGAIVGHAENLSYFTDTEDTDGDGDTTETIYVNGAVNIRNCFVDLDEKYFISTTEQGTQTDTSLRGVHGGVAGFVSTNALSVSDCVVIGITPYATTSCITFGDVQHSGMSIHFSNVYTNTSTTYVEIGGTTNIGVQDFTGHITQLAIDQMKGVSAIDNMDLDWSLWFADDNGYPELRSTHKNISIISNNNGTHTEVCGCGFGGIVSNCVYEEGKCTICKPKAICSEKKTIYWDGTISYGFADQSAGTKDDPVIINTASELAYLTICKESISTLSDGSPKYFKIADDIGNIVLQDKYYADVIMSLNNATAVKAYFERYGSYLYYWPNMGWERASFCGYFDGNGVKIHGLYQVSNNNAGLFSSIDAGASFHNLAIMNSYFKATSSNYQVGAIAAVGNGIDYGIKENGVVWFDSCIVANCYMRNSSSDSQRSGIIVGNVYEEAAIIENCFVYDNSAYYGDGYQYKIPLIGNARNNIKSTSRKPAELVVKVEHNVNDTGVDMFLNTVSNTVVFGTDIVNTRVNFSYRFNEPECFENCYTDGATGTVELLNGSWTYSDSQIKSANIYSLKNENLGDAWVKTNETPILKAFHSFVGINNGDGTHSHICDCGITGLPENHTKGQETRENIVDPTCLALGSYDSVYYCSECSEELSRETITVSALEHTYDDDFDTNCNACNEPRNIIDNGDVNNDGAINNKDYALLMRFINGWEISVTYDACDTNRDGNINNKDCSILMQYINGWDICLHKYYAATCTEPKYCAICGITTGDSLGHRYVAGECSRVNNGVVCNDYDEQYCPKLYFTGDMSKIIQYDQTSKKIECNIDVEYRSAEQIVNRTAKIKIQGNSSTQWRKKNYTITFYEDDTYDNKLGIDVGWGTQNKYCLKANWIDKTHSRNLVTAKLAGEIQHKYGLFETAPNYGAVDGFPVEIYINGEFHGLYTMNIPKDEWQFNMDKDDPNHIVICGENWNDPVLFKDEPNLTDWSVEMGPETEETLAKVKRLSDFIRFSSDEEFKANIEQYLDLDSTLNYYVMMNYAHLVDNRGKNMLLATYDGKVWYPSLYDLDTSWGTNWKGDGLYSYRNDLSGSIRQSYLWQRIEDNFSQEIAQRYFELRSDILEPNYVMSKFYEFADTIPQEVLDRETQKWTLPNDPIPGYDLNQIESYLDIVVDRLDSKFISWLY